MPFADKFSHYENESFEAWVNGQEPVTANLEAGIFPLDMTFILSLLLAFKGPCNTICVQERYAYVSYDI